jgi:hypothetical protein
LIESAHKILFKSATFLKPPSSGFSGMLKFSNTNVLELMIRKNITTLKWNTSCHMTLTVLKFKFLNIWIGIMKYKFNKRYINIAESIWLCLIPEQNKSYQTSWWSCFCVFCFVLFVVVDFCFCFCIVFIYFLLWKVNRLIISCTHLYKTTSYTFVVKKSVFMFFSILPVYLS